MKTRIAVLAALAAFAAASAAHGARRFGKLVTPGDLVSRVAMFVIPVNTESSDAYTGFELRASTNNFSGAAGEGSRLQFYAQSEIADEPFGMCDRMRLYVCTSFGSDDPRSYTPIGNTIVWTNRLTTVVALVDASCLSLHPGGDWLRSDNASLTWGVLRNRPVHPATETEDGTDAAQWRPIAPVAWLGRMPTWAR